MSSVVSKRQRGIWIGAIHYRGESRVPNAQPLSGRRSAERKTTTVWHSGLRICSPFDLNEQALFGCESRLRCSQGSDPTNSTSEKGVS